MSGTRYPRAPQSVALPWAGSALELRSRSNASATRPPSVVLGSQPGPANPPLPDEDCALEATGEDLLAAAVALDVVATTLTSVELTPSVLEELVLALLAVAPWLHGTDDSDNLVLQWADQAGAREQLAAALTTPLRPTNPKDVGSALARLQKALLTIVDAICLVIEARAPVDYWKS